MDDAELLPTARQLAERLASGPTHGFARIKQAIYAAEKHALDAQLQEGWTVQTTNLTKSYGWA